METKEKTTGWTKSGSIYTFLVKNHGKVTFDKSKASAELIAFFLDYGIGRIFPDRTSQLKGMDKLEGMRKLIALAESGSKTLSVRETAEERTAREQTERYNDLVECFRRFDGRDAAATDKAIATICERQKWGVKDNGVAALLGTPQLKRIYQDILLERKFEKAKPSDLDVSDIFEELGK